MRTSLALLLMIFLIPLSASAWSGPIQFSELGYPQDLDAARKAKVAKVLQFLKDELKFINGTFFGVHATRQRFGGNSAQTAQWVRLLQDADVWDLTVQFRDLKDKQIAFEMTTDYKQSLNIIINSEREDFLLKDFAPLLKPQIFPATGEGKPAEPELGDANESAALTEPSPPPSEEPNSKPALPEIPR